MQYAIQLKHQNLMKTFKCPQYLNGLGQTPKHIPVLQGTPYDWFDNPASPSILDTVLIPQSKYVMAKEPFGFGR